MAHPTSSALRDACLRRHNERQLFDNLRPKKNHNAFALPVTRMVAQFKN